MKKLIFIAMVFVLTFSFCSPASAAISKQDNSIEEYYEIGTYDYLTGKEEYSTMRLSDDILQELRNGEVLSSPGWCPESLDQAPSLDELKSEPLPDSLSADWYTTYYTISRLKYRQAIF